MNDTITLVGFVATPPRHIVTAEGLAITSFRLATTHRKYDRSKSAWVDGDTNWYSITGFRQLAINVAGSVVKGDRLIVSGRLRVRDWIKDSKSGTTIEIEAEAIGHDLLWGTTAFTRSVSTSLGGVRQQQPEPEGASAEAEPGRVQGATDDAGWAVPGGTPPTDPLEAGGNGSGADGPASVPRAGDRVVPDSVEVPF